MNEDKSPTKTSLSHTISLPVQTRDAPNHNKPNNEESKKVAAGKSWSFGTMAKAVGCGVTAFGSGAKAVGTGVVQGSKAVGTGVVLGTKAAGKVTKDVTLAAGKGVYQAGEKVGTVAVTGVNTTVQAGKDLTNASVSAVTDTTKWVISRTESLLNECTVHVVLPGETIEEISRQTEVWFPFMNLKVK